MRETKKYHFIGIGGIGMSAIARILLDKKIPISGSDLSVTDNIAQLINKGAQVYKGHSEANISPGDTVVFTSQIQKNNPEYQAALQLKCPMLHRSELLAHLMGGYETLAVAGSHGKTTTSSLLATVLILAGQDPTFAVGGMVSGLNGKLGTGKYFVAEADESDGSFLRYSPRGAIITNVEPEHLDHYKTEEALHSAFRSFIAGVQDTHLLFYCGDESTLTSLTGGRGISYGFGEENQLRITHFRQKGWSSSFTLHFEGKCYPDMTLSLIGEHNALNAAAVFGLCIKLGLAEEKIREAFEKFPGVGRRCEKKGEINEVLILDDYAHHPTEVKKTIFAIKQAVGERRLIVVFQPHRYSRTKDLLDEFSKSFDMADLVYITDIYGAFEEPIEGVSAEILVEKIKQTSTVPCAYMPQAKLCDELKNILRPHDVVVTAAAGQISGVHAGLLKDFSPRKIQVGFIFGGSSCEHEISVRSARFVAAALNQALYDVRFFAIDKQGLWVVGKEAEEILASKSIVDSKNAKSMLDPEITEELQACDLFIPVLHGTFGEDGTIQGFFEMLGKPYFGPDYRSAAICMDKVLTKRIVETAGIKTPRDMTFGHLSWMTNKQNLIKQICETLKFPVYVKPVHLGSSVGIHRVNEPKHLEEAIQYAFRFDTQVMIEEGKINCRELEFAVVGNTYSFSVEAPAPGEKLALGEFVDYEKKYGQMAVSTTIYPDISAELVEKGRELACLAYRAVGATGMTRVDFLLDADGEYWLFEMNPIPGLQSLSLFPKIWQREGRNSQQLIDRLIILALERYRTHKRHYRCLANFSG